MGLLRGTTSNNNNNNNSSNSNGGGSSRRTDGKLKFASIKQQQLGSALLLNNNNNNNNDRLQSPQSQQSLQQQQQQNNAVENDYSKQTRRKATKKTDSSSTNDNWGEGLEEDDDDFAPSATKIVATEEVLVAEEEEDIIQLDNKYEAAAANTESVVAEEADTKKGGAEEGTMKMTKSNTVDGGDGGEISSNSTQEEIESATEEQDDQNEDGQEVDTETEQEENGKLHKTAPFTSQQQMLDLSNFASSTTLCQDDPTLFIHPTTYNATATSCTDLFTDIVEDGSGGEMDSNLVKKEKKCEDTVGFTVDDDEDGDDNGDGKVVEGGKEVMKVKDFCKRSCGLCSVDDNSATDKADKGEGSSSNNSNAGEEEEDAVETIMEEEEEEEEISQIKETALDGKLNTNDGDDGKLINEEEEDVKELEVETNKKGVEKVDDGESGNNKDISGIDTTEKDDKLTFKEADEDDAFIPVVEEEKGEEAKEQVENGTEDDFGEISKGEDSKSAQEEEDTATDVGLEKDASATTAATTNEEKVSATTDEKDEQQLEKDMEDKLVSALEEGTVNKSSSKDSSICQDDPNFTYKSHDGFNCVYIKENKPDKCDKKHDGVKVGIVSCPVSCNMVNECMALQEQNNTAVTTTDETAKETSVEPVDEQQLFESEEEAPTAINNNDEQATGQQDELQLEKKMESELETALENGTVDEETAEKLDEEMFEALEEGVGEVFEKELEEELGLAGGDNEQESSSKEKVATEVDAGDQSKFNEDASTIEVDDPPVVANLTIGEDDLPSFCQDDPDFKFKGYDGFDCDYIKENKPEKCHKLHDGETVGVVSCPVSCNMVDECMALQQQKVPAVDTQFDTEENEMVNVTANEDFSEETADPTEASIFINEEESVSKVVENEEDGLDEKAAMTDEGETVAEANNKIITTNGVCQDDPDFKFKGYDGFNCEYIKENKPDKCEKLYSGEKVGVVSCPVSCDMVEECMALQQVKESVVAEVDFDENDGTIGGETESKDDESKVEKQATALPSETGEGDGVETGEGQGLDNQELEQEIEAKLVKAVEEGELDEGEAEELEYEMEEALEEGVGEIFEAELDKELRCKDDLDFALPDDDGQLRGCSWIRQNERCEQVHEYTGKVIGKFFCPETCGMKEECEKVTASDSTLQAKEVEDKTSGKDEDDAFESVLKGTKSMADEIYVESELENGNIYGTENVNEPMSGGDTASNSFAYQNEGGAIVKLGDDTYADEEGDNFNIEGEDDMYNKYKDTENLNQWDNQDGLPASQEYNQEPNSNVGYSEANGVDNSQGNGGESQQEGNFDNMQPSIDYDENWLDDDSGFPFGLLILLFLGVTFVIFRKSQSSRQQDHSRGGYQQVGRRIDIEEHNKRY